MNRSATVVYSNENVGVGLSRYSFGSGQALLSSGNQGTFVSGTMISARAQQAWMWEISTPPSMGGGTETEARFPEIRYFAEVLRQYGNP